MKKIHLGLFCSALILLGAEAGLLSDETKTKSLSVSFDQVLTTSKGVFTSKVWIKGNKKRTETENKDRKQIDIITGNSYFQLFPDQGFAQEIPMAARQEMNTVDAIKQNKEVTHHVDHEDGPTMDIGKEVVADQECKLYQWRCESSFIRVWISDKFPFPLRWEEIDKKEGTFSYQVRNLTEVDIPDSYFEVPSGLKVINADPGATTFPTPPPQ